MSVEEKARSRTEELLGPQDQESSVVRRLGLLRRLQYRLFRTGESVSHSHWSSDLRFVVLASAAVVVVLLAVLVAFGGVDLLRGSIAQPEERPAPVQALGGD